MHTVHLYLLFCGTFWNISFVGNDMGICRKSFACCKWRGHMQEKFCLQEMAWVNGKLLDYYDQKQAKKAQK